MSNQDQRCEASLVSVLEQYSSCVGSIAKLPSVSVFCNTTATTVIAFNALNAYATMGGKLKQR